MSLSCSSCEVSSDVVKRGRCGHFLAPCSLSRVPVVLVVTFSFKSSDVLRVVTFNCANSSVWVVAVTCIDSYPVDWGSYTSWVRYISHLLTNLLTLYTY